jgi:predicted component of type VI protein secretion system
MVLVRSTSYPNHFPSKNKKPTPIPMQAIQNTESHVRFFLVTSLLRAKSSNHIHAHKHQITSDTVRYGKAQKEIKNRSGRGKVMEKVDLARSG